MPKKVVISGYYGFDNFGDECILDVLIEHLKDVGYLGSEITVISKNPKKSREKHRVNAIGTFSFFKIIYSILKSDVLISGGGSLLQDVTSLRSLFYYLWVICLALFFQKKIFIFAQGIGPINNVFARFLTKNILKRCNLITVRDDKSLFLLRGWGIEADLHADPVFNIKLAQHFPLNRVGIQLRSFKTLKDDFIFELATQVAAQFKDKQIYIYSLQNSQDLEICKRFQGYLSFIDENINSEIISNLSNAQIIDSIGTLDYMISMRYHACLVALKYGIKTLAIKYDIKLEALAKQAGIACVALDKKDTLGYHMQEMKNLSKRDILDKVNNIKFDFSKFDNLADNSI